MIQNKKADIPITILVLGVLLVCTLAITSFIISELKNRTDTLGIEVLKKIDSEIEKFDFYLNLGFSKGEAAEKINATIDGSYLVITEEGFRSSSSKKPQKFFSVEYKRRLE